MRKERIYYRQIAELHSQNLKEGFLSSLGAKFLALLYESIDNSEAAVLITKSTNGRVIGFVAGAKSLVPIYRQLLRQPLTLLTSLAPAMLNPVKIWRMTEIFLYGLQPHFRRNEKPESERFEFELISIAVATNERRSGVAKHLYEQLVAYSLQKGIPNFKIMVGENLDGAHKFYRNVGAVPVGEVRVHGSNRSIKYVHTVIAH